MSASKQKYILDLLLMLNPRITVGDAARRLNRVKKVCHGKH